MSVLNVSDFASSKYEVSVSEFTIDRIQEYIDRYETMLLIQLMGKELYDLWDGSTDPIYLKLTNAWVEQLSDGCVVQSRGIVDMLAGFVYFEYVRDQYTQQTINGAVKAKGQNSDPANFPMTMLHTRYMEALDNYNAIQAYIKDNAATYPEYNGVTKHPLLPI